MTDKPTKVKARVEVEAFSDSGPLHGELVAGNIIITKGDVEILSVPKVDAKPAAGVLLALSR